MVYVMTGGGPAQATFVNVFYIYRRAFEFFEFGYSSAIAFFLCIVIFLVSYVILRTMNTGRID
jgi:ABC-type sugar transport system permease subunit